MLLWEMQLEIIGKEEIMQKRARLFLVGLLAFTLLVSCAAPELHIVRHPVPIDLSSINPTPEVPVWEADSGKTTNLDFRSADLTSLDLWQSLDALLISNFDSKTKWPPDTHLPAGFIPENILASGKNPGLGLRALHDQGIDGRGVGIAIIDQTPLVDHVEIIDRFKVYEEGTDVIGTWQLASMHGTAVASIAVGKTTGVAPAADLYYISSGNCGLPTDSLDFDFSCMAKDISRIVEINKSLPDQNKIRVLSLSMSWGPKSKGYVLLQKALDDAMAAGIFVISDNLSSTYGLKFNGVGRSPLYDPDDFYSYGPGSWWQNDFYAQGLPADTLLVPMDTRTTASPTGINDYAYYGQGGWAWCVPYLAGIYALAWQVQPGISPALFWSSALKTGKTIDFEHAGKFYSLGVILDPTELIESLKK
jgi:hypothetical protein